MLPRSPARHGTRVVALIAVVTAVPLGALLWVGWHLLEQDRALEQQQIAERVARAGDAARTALEQAVAASEARVRAGATDWPDHAVSVTFTAHEIRAIPASRAAYLPVVSPLPEASEAAFASADALELAAHDLGAAARALDVLTTSSNRATQAGALLRRGRVAHAMGHPEEALATYARMSRLDDVAVGGTPASLVAAYARGRILAEAGAANELRALASDLASDLHAGRWTLTPAQYALYREDIARWMGPADLPAPRDPEILGDAIATLWTWWQAGRFDVIAGRQALATTDRPVIVVWQVADGRLVALLALPEFAESQWFAPARAAGRLHHTVVSIRQRMTARRIDADDGSRPAPLRLSDAELPWTVAVTSVDPAPEHAAFRRRRLLLAGGLALVALLGLAAGYLALRAVSRELAVARLQSEFVAAVSHEFRTPLTSLRQFTDMLIEHPTLDSERRRTAYEAQSRATTRLTRLVESLLDLGRIEAGGRPYRLQPHDLTALVRDVVEDLRAEVRPAGYDVTLACNGSIDVNADGEALSRAIRNVLDNAVKYSNEPHGIAVSIERRGRDVRVDIRDRGVGIPKQEQEAVFGRFERGAQARALGIPGTGIGLAMVRDIVREHGGRVLLESEPGRGSTFTIVLPVKE